MPVKNYSPRDGFPYYFDLARDKNIQEAYDAKFTFNLLDQISEAKSTFRYDLNKWSIKQLVGHIADHERIKIYRAFLLSRKINVELWGYDQELLVENSRFEAVPFKLLYQDFINVRQASISFIQQLSEEQLLIKGTAGRHEITLAEFLLSIVGHEIHHINILQKKYLEIAK